CPAGEQLLLVGQARALEFLLDRAEAAPDTGPLSGALALAAEKHALVLGIHLQQNFVKGLEELKKLKNGWQMPNDLEPLLRIESGTVVLDLLSQPRDPVTRLDVDLRLAFADEDKAQQNLASIQGVQKFLLDLLAKGAGEGSYSEFWGEVLVPARTAAWQRQG